MTETSIARLIIAPSHPQANRVIERYLEEGKADVLRIPRPIAVINGAENDALTKEMLGFITTLLTLHNPTHVTLIDDDGLACIEAASVIIDLLRKDDRRTSLSHNLFVREGNPESSPPDDWNTVTVCCCDYRTPFEMIRTEYRNPDSYSFVVPGAAKALVGTEAGRQFFAWAAERGLGVRLFQHEDCDAYEPGLHADPQQELQIHQRDARAFVEQAENQNIPVIDMGIIRLNGKIEPL